MKFIIGCSDNHTAHIETCVYVPHIIIGKKVKTDIGRNFRKTEIDLSTTLIMNTTNNTFEFVFKILGFGFSLNIKEK